MGRTVKSITKCSIKGGKVPEWFAASLAVSPFSLCCSLRGRLANFALVKFRSGSGSYIFRFFIASRFLTLRKQILYENKCLNRYVNF